MGLPAKLKNMNLFHDGTSFLGMVPEVTLPPLKLMTEDFRGGGMLGPIPVDLGLDKLEMEFTAGGLMREPLRKFGVTAHDGVLLRFAGAYQADTTARVMAAEVIGRGRYTEMDMGNAKPGSDTEHKYKAGLSYYKLVIDGQQEIEIDMLNGVFNVGGADRYAEIRAAIGA